ncbi:hypothetical protein ACIPSE_17110 [Streptomyces sp. NPDC090106]|uniref:hypothetical protein n=1 Tax=Streptomyces sp. NPDC090106 TaxID=3365946 RepID=UPI003801CD0B
MSTGVIIALIVIVAAVIAGAFLFARRAPGGRDLKRRFGPEYERAVARHDGDTQAAERELGELVSRHGSLRERELEPARRQMYEARWTAAQERFVDSPRDALGEADRLLAEVARDRGFPDGEHEEQVAALSVHHADHVHGYRLAHRAARSQEDGEGRTEEMRTAMVEARALFQDLLGRPARRRGPSRDEARGEERASASDGENRQEQQNQQNQQEQQEERRGALPWALNRRQVKGS